MHGMYLLISGYLSINKVQNTKNTVQRSQKANKLKYPSEEGSVPTGMEKKVITSGEKMRNLCWNVSRGRGASAT